MQVAPDYKDIGKRMRNIPMLADLDVRFRVMDTFEDYQQVLSLPTPPIENIASGAGAADLARAANDGMAELVARYPDRFPGFVAALVVRRSRRRCARGGPRDRRSRRARHPDVHQRPRHADLRAGVSADLRGAGVARSADLAAPVSRRGCRRLQGGGSLAVRNLVDLRLAVRDQRGDGAPGVRRLLRPLSGAEDHHPPHGRDGAVLRRAGRAGLGSARRAHVGRGSLRGAAAR